MTMKVPDDLATEDELYMKAPDDLGTEAAVASYHEGTFT